jgi:flagellar biosynthesis/type III secretory pathway protein FliH
MTMLRSQWKRNAYAEAWRAGFEAGLEQGKCRFGTGAKDGDEKSENPDTFKKLENS